MVKGSLEKLRLTFLKAPEPTADELSEILREIRLQIRPTLHEAAKVFPHPPGGRPHKLGAEESRNVCQEIDGLVLAGMDLSEAQKRLARKSGVSLRTIQRRYRDFRNWKMRLKGPKTQRP